MIDMKLSHTNKPQSIINLLNTGVYLLITKTQLILIS